jgi:hypothetical protein
MNQPPERPEDALPDDGAVTAKDGSVVIVRDNDTVGAVILGLMAIVLLVAFLRAEGRHRALLAQLAARSV